MAVAPEDQVDGSTPSEVVCGIIGGAVDQQDGRVAPASGFQFRGNSVSFRIILLYCITGTGELGSHYAAGIIDRITYNAYFHGSRLALRAHGVLLQDHIVLRAGNALAVTVKIRAEDGHVVDEVSAAPVIVRKGGVRIHQGLQAPVEFVVAHRNRIVVHKVHGHIQRPAVLQIGNARALVDVASVQQQPAIFVRLHLICNICKAVMLAVGPGMHYITVDVRCLIHGQHIHPRHGLLDRFLFLLLLRLFLPIRRRHLYRLARAP